jgi:ribulose-phosphate 3-epimerase
MSSVKIAPSILSADFGRLGDEIKAIEEGGADIIHVDVMDGHFVPNITFGPPVVEKLRLLTKLPLDVHLMITNADMYIDAFAGAGADWLSVHVEACVHLNRTINRIKELGLKAGAVLNPATSINTLSYILDDLDFILIMSVNPGFGGQVFMPGILKKLRDLRGMMNEKGRFVPIEIDGGISPETIRDAAAAGAELFVAGSAILGTKDYKAAISEMRENAQEGIRDR